MELRAVLSDLVRTVATGDDPPPAPPRRGRMAWLGRHLQVTMVAIALGMAMGGTVGAQGVPSFVALLIGVTSALPLLLVVRHSLWAWRLAMVAAVVLGVSWRSELGASWPWNPVQFIVLLFVLLVVSARQDRGVVVWVWLLSSALVWVFVDAQARVGVVLLFSGILLLGYQIGRRRQAQRRLAAEQERGAILAERARIARELHDVVAHHMSLIAVRAESAPYRVGELSEPARAELAEISAAARTAMAEMRRLLGVLRSDGTFGDGAPVDGAVGRPGVAGGPAGVAGGRAGVAGGPAGATGGPPTAPQPRLADLPALVDAARGAGVSVTLESGGQLDGLPVAVDVSAYRIVQEALSNATRHAAGAAVTVAVHRDGGRLELRVANGPGRTPARRRGPGHGFGSGSGPAEGAGPGPGSGSGLGSGLGSGQGGAAGHGLRGMRERASMLGGEVSATPTDDGGFVVRATVPIDGGRA